MVKIISHIMVHAHNLCLCAALLGYGHQGTYAFSYIERTEFLNYESCFRDFLLEKQSPLAAYFSNTEWVAKFTCVTYSTYSTNSVCHIMGR